MSTTLRSAASFLGMPPIFRRREAAPLKRAAARRDEPRQAQPVSAQRSQPVMRETSPQAGKAPGGVDFDKLLAAARKAPVDLSVIEWEGDAKAKTAAPSAFGASTGTWPVFDPTTTVDNDPRGNDARCRRIRDRYIGARFPGVARCAADLEVAERVIKSARLYFEDSQVDTALELLDVAIEQDSRAEALWLAQLEILFLARNAARFVECARAFRALHGSSEAWAEVSRLGRALAPKESLFDAAKGPRDHDHYGPWPDLPNWIQANWDLTAEVVASDFRRAMKRRAEAARAARMKPQLAA
ncbi:MAG: hypothetical protein ACXWGU_14320 [Usitatibacter sp.]